MKRAALLAALLLLSGCAARSTYRPPATVLDRSVFLEEVDEFGHHHPISAATEQSAMIVRVPLSVRVDENSSIRVAVHSGNRGTDTLGIAAMDSLRQRVQATRQLLSYLSKLEVAHANALTTLSQTTRVAAPARWESPEFAGFVAARREFGKLDAGLVRALEPLWPEDTPGGDAVDRLLGQRMTQPDKLRAFINDHLASLEDEMRRVDDDVKSRGATLRLEAFLQRKGDPTAIHLEGYDKIEQLALEHHDRFGVDLTESQRLEVMDLARGSQELADAAEQVRKGEASVSAAFANVSSSSGQIIGTIIVEGDSLRAQATTTALADRAKRLKAAFATLRADVVADLGAEQKRVWLATVDSTTKLLTDMLSPAATWKESERLFAGVSGLRVGTRSPEDLVIVATGLVPTARALLSGDLRTLQDALVSVRDLVETQLNALPEDARRVAIASWQGSVASAEVNDLCALGQRFKQFGTVLGEMTNLLSASPGTLSTTVPQAFDVPFEGAPETAIQLQLTPRERFDRVTLRASMIEGTSQVATTSFNFVVERYGYWASLEPSVVVAYPYQLADRSGRFAPALSWLHAYRPRPDAGGVMPLVRLLSPSVGIHAAFLNFGTSVDRQIGLGGTIALWRGMFQAGYGWNILARDASDGERYYFVGSSLIAWLHGSQSTTASGASSSTP